MVKYMPARLTPSTLLQQLSIECAHEMLRDLGIDVAIVPDVPLGVELVQCSVVAFYSDLLRGNVVVAASTRRLSALGAMEDSPWTGELANQLLGRIKNRLLRYGVDAALGVPVTLNGRFVRIELRSHQGRPPEVFAVEDGYVTFWIDVECEPSLELEEQPLEDCAVEGGFVAF